MSRRLLLALHLVGGALASACGGSDKVTTPDGGGDTDDTDVTIEPCAAVIASLEPADGATGVATDAQIVATFTEPVGGGEYAILVDGVGGTTVLGADGTTATFTADVPFAYDTAYTATVSVCTTTQTTTFTTVPEPGTSVDPDLVTGSTYAVYFPDLKFREPPQFVIDLAGTFGLDTDFYVLVGIQSYDPANDSLTAAATTGQLDDAGVMIPACDAALSGIVADFSQNPIFTVGPTDFSIPFDADGDLTVEDFTLTGTITVDAALIEDVAFSGALDMRPTGQDCSVVQGFGGTCIPCNDGEVECLVLDATSKQAPRVDGLDLTVECGL